jgi:hypothetical protein
VAKQLSGSTEADIAHLAGHDYGQALQTEASYGHENPDVTFMMILYRQNG